MPKQPDEVELREIPGRPFGVYVLTIIMLAGIFAAAMEISRAYYPLKGVWWEQAYKYLRDYSGLLNLIADLFKSPVLAAAADSLGIIIWGIIIVGLWLLQRWAWVLMMIVTGLLLTYSLFRYFDGRPDYISMVINVAVVFYLNDHSVQRVFARRRSAVQP